MVSLLRIGVADIVQRPGTRKPVRVSAVVPGLVVTGSAVPAGEEISADVMLEAVREGVLASGRVTALWEAQCRRCLGAVHGSLTVEVRELYEPDPTEGESYALSNEQVDLEPLVREAVLLDLPQAPLCRDDCQGLCPTCGVDLNEGPCSCVADDRDPRWAALDALRADDD